MVIKNDGSRQVFDKNKLLTGLVRSCDKRDISMERIVAFADSIERDIYNKMEREISSKQIGEMVMNRLKDFDDVAYIRFASVYRKFADISSFRDELDELIKEKEKSSAAENGNLQEG